MTTVPVAVKMTGASEPAVALNVFAPALGPRVHEPTVAIPAASVGTEPPLTEPPPLCTTNSTVTPATGAPFWSVTRTDGAGETALFAAPVSVVLVVATIVVGTEGSVPLSPLHALNASTTIAAVDRSAMRVDLLM